MSDLKISELLDGGSANLNDQIAVARTGVNYELTLGEVKVLVLGTIATDVSNNALAITALQGDRLKLDGSNGPMTGNLSMGANKITSTYVPAADADLVNRKYITDNYLPLAGGVMTGAITLHSTGTPGSGSEPVSYTFAEATYAKANGTDGFVARFSPNGTSFAESKIRDDGTTSSINGVVSATDQLKIYSSLDAALNIEASGTKGISILSDFGSDSGFGVSSKVANGATVYALYGALPSTAGTITGNYYGVFATGTHTNAGQTIGGDIYGVYGNARHTAGTFGDGAGNGGDLYGVYGQASYSNTTDPMNSLEKMAALYAYSSVSSGATAANGHGVQSQFDVDGTLTNGYSFYAGSSLSSGEITNYHAFYSNGSKATTCTVAYGLRLAAHTTGTTKYGIYQEGVNDINYFDARIGIGDNNPSSSTMLKIVPDDKWGIYVDSDQNTTSVISAYIADIANTGTGNIEAFYSTSAGSNDASANVSLFHSNGVTAGTQANSYGLYLTAHAAGTNKWGVYQAGSGDDNYFAGAVAVGATDEVSNVSSHKGIQINGDDSNKAILNLDSQSKQNAFVSINHNTSGTGGDENSLVIFQQNNTTEWMIGMNGSASSAAGHRSVANEFVVSHGLTFDLLADRMIVVQDSSSGPKTVMGIGAEPNPGSVLTLGTTGSETEIIAASTTGTASTRNGWIQVEVGGTNRYIPLYETI